jgi:hypothetical protein
MTRCVATALAVLITVIGATSIGSAQPVLNVQGVLQSVDCRANSVTLKMPDGVHVFSTTRYTAVFIDSVRDTPCSLSRYVGNQATVSLTPSGSQFVAGRIDIATLAQPVPPTPSSGYAQPSPSVGYAVPPYPYAPYYATPYCYAPYPGAYYGPPYCYGPYAGYYHPYPGGFYGPPFFFSVGVVIGPRHFFHHR